MFEGELFIRNLSTILLQVVCELIYYFKVIFKSMAGPNNTQQVDPGMNGLNYCG